MPAVPRRYFNLQESQSMALQFRESNALEYIAYYLDRIEEHLARSAEDTAKIQVSLALIAQNLGSGVNR